MHKPNPASLDHLATMLLDYVDGNLDEHETSKFLDYLDEQGLLDKMDPSYKAHHDRLITQRTQLEAAK